MKNTRHFSKKNRFTAFLITAFLGLPFLSCSPFSDGEGSVTVSFDSSIIEYVSLARTGLNYDNSQYPEEERREQFIAEVRITGGHKATASHVITDSEIKNLEAVKLSVKNIPAGANITVNAAIKYKMNNVPEVEYENIEKQEFTIYEGSKAVKVSAGISSVEISLKNATAPYFTNVMKDTYIKKTDSYPVLSFYGHLVVPDGYYSFTDNYDYITSNMWSYVISYPGSINSLMTTFNEWIDRGAETQISGYRFSYITNDTSDLYTKSFREDEDSGYKFSSTWSADNGDGPFITGWIVKYKTPSGEERTLVSPATTHRLVDATTPVTTEVHYTGKTYKDPADSAYPADTAARYILTDEFDPDAFEIIENWGGTLVEADLDLYRDSCGLANIEAGTSIGDYTLTFDRGDGFETGALNLRLRWLLPDLDNYELKVRESGISLKQKNRDSYGIDRELRLPPTTDNPTGEYVPACTYSLNWMKDGLALSFTDDEPRWTINFLEDGFGAGSYSVEVTLSPAENTVRYCLKENLTDYYDVTGGVTDSVSRTYESVTVTTSQIQMMLSLYVPAFTLTAEAEFEENKNVTNTDDGVEIALRNENALFKAFWTGNGEAGNIQATPDDYSFTWYLNGTPVREEDFDDGNLSVFKFNPVQIDTSYYSLTTTGKNTVMLVLSKESDPDQTRSEVINFTLSE